MKKRALMQKNKEQSDEDIPPFETYYESENIKKDHAGSDYTDVYFERRMECTRD